MEKSWKNLFRVFFKSDEGQINDVSKSELHCREMKKMLYDGQVHGSGTEKAAAGVQPCGGGMILKLENDG